MTMTRRIGPRLAAPLTSALLLIALSQPWPLRAAGATVRILESFDPSTVTVAPGMTVTWVNESGNRHRVRSTSGPAEFDSGDLEPGESFSVTLTTIGTYEYLDDRNRDDSAYWARVVVANDAPAPTATTNPTPAPVGTPTPAPASATVGMAGEIFRPATVTIVPGGSVTWTNDDGRTHTVSSTSTVFDSGNLAPGQSYRWMFPTAGTFQYLCLIHPRMTGTVIVAAPGTTPPPPDPTPPPMPTPAPTPATTPSPGPNRAVDYAFEPTALTVAAGSRVSFVNAGRAPHTLTAVDGSFDSGMVNAGAIWRHTFSTPGTYRFLCALHPQMTGTLRVTDATGNAPPPASNPVPTSTIMPPTGQSSSAPISASIRDFDFVPATLEVPVGSTVRWVNDGVVPHTVSDRAGTFDSGILATGATWSHTFDQAGTFVIWCVIHPDMAGQVVVSPGTGAPAAGQSPPVSSGAGPLAVPDMAGPGGGNAPGTGDAVPGGSGADGASGTNGANMVGGQRSPIGAFLAIAFSVGAVGLYLRLIGNLVRHAADARAVPPQGRLRADGDLARR